MGKWHGRNKSNKQRRGNVLFSKTRKTFLSTQNSINLPIIFYCKICKFETEIENIWKNHICKESRNTS